MHNKMVNLRTHHIVHSMNDQKWPNLEQIAAELCFIAKYSENIQGFQKKVYKNISGGIFLKHPLKSTSHLIHVDFRENILISCKMILYLYLSNYLFI